MNRGGKILKENKKEDKKESKKESEIKNLPFSFKGEFAREAAKQGEIEQQQQKLSFKQKLKNFWGKISYSVMPFILFVAVLAVTFYGNEVIYWLRGGEGALQFHKLPIDDQIPLVTWFIYFYYLTFPLGIVTWFYVAWQNRRALADIFYTLIISFAISGVIYFFFQTHLTKPDFTPVTFTDKLVVSTWGATDPINNFPSQHAFMAIAVILGCLTCGGSKKSWWFKVPAILCAIMVIMSTFFTKQHYFVDWIASACIMIPTFFAVRAVRKRKEKKGTFHPFSTFEKKK